MQSTTGLIVVGEALPPRRNSPPLRGEHSLHSVRYLRAAHSILGGVWTNKRVQVLDATPPLTDSHGTQLGDSIYGVFVLQEAVRLVNSTGKTGGNALVMYVLPTNHDWAAPYSAEYPSCFCISAVG